MLADKWDIVKQLLSDRLEVYLFLFLLIVSKNEKVVTATATVS